jgi:hypothetical protein
LKFRKKIVDAEMSIKIGKLPPKSGELAVLDYHMSMNEVIYKIRKNEQKHNGHCYIRATKTELELRALLKKISK